MKYLLIVFLGLVMTACSGNYKVKQEASKNNDMLKEVPKWFVVKPVSKNYMYGSGVATSPDLNLAIKKANLIAKAEIADIINGEMNERATFFSTEVGRDKGKTTVQEFDRTIVNVISKTAVVGYEIAEQEIFTTAFDEYRVYILMQFSYDDQNKLWEKIINDSVSQINTTAIKDANIKAIDKEYIDTYNKIITKE
jgi:hypothetical protein